MKIEKVVTNTVCIHSLLQQEFNISNKLLSFLIKNKLILCNDVVCDTRNIAKAGDVITILMDYAEDNSNIVPSKMDLEILFEDEWLLVLNKPSGIAIHPSILHYDNSLSNGVRYYFDKIGLHKKIRPVNRLDFYTSGIVVFAKCAYIHEQLSNQMQENSFSKQYLALVHGSFDSSTGVIDVPIARKSDSIIERCVDFENGQNACTEFEILKYFENSDTSLVNCKLLTGRTHQIRVHFSYIGHPLVGDSLYGSDVSDDGQFLHCSSLVFEHPITRKKLNFKNIPKWAEV